MKRRLAPASIVFLLASVLVSCFPFYRYQNAACKQRGTAFAARVEKLKQDAQEKLRIGTEKDVVIRFFAENGIALAFVRGEASGTISTTGCAPAGCGSDSALIGLRVNVDDTGTTTAEPLVVALYSDCL